MEGNEVKERNSGSVEEGKSLAWLSYLGILLLIPLLVKPDNDFCKHHVKQGLVILIAWIVLGVIQVIPFLGWIIGFIGMIILIVLIIMGIVNSLQGKFWEAPMGIYKLSEKFKF